MNEVQNMIIDESIVLKTIAELMDSKRSVDPDDLMKALDIPDFVLIKYLKSINQKGYTTQVFEEITLTDRGLRAYQALF